MLKNPYPFPTDEDDKASSRFQTYVDPSDKSLLVGLRPVKGTAQAAVNHLFKNLCHDLRDLGIEHYRPDADDILSILVERRPLTDEQIARIRCTTVGTTASIPSWLQQHRRVTEVRKRSTDTSTESTKPQVDAPSGVKRDRKDKASASKSHKQAQETTNDSTERVG